MPGGDRTGPWGQGPGTGGGRGGCVPSGRGMRSGRGRGWGFSRFFGAVRNAFVPYSADDEAAELKAERDAINARLAEIEKEKK
jgi:hypothetical protein